MISHQVPQEISFDRWVGKKKSESGIGRADLQGKTKSTACVLFIRTQGDTESTCMSQQGVNAGWGEEVWELIGMKFETMRNEVKFRDCKCRGKDRKKNLPEIEAF